MLRSMTGYGQAQGEISGGQCAVEIRSVNSRYFKAVVRLPELWCHMEADVEQHLRSRLTRGTVHFVLRMKTLSAESAYEINVAALERYIEQLDALRPEQSDIRLTVDMATLLMLPGVCVPPEPQDLCEKSRPALVALVDQAVDALLEMRRQEGQTIARDLLDNGRLIHERLKEVAARAGKVVEDYHQRLRRRVMELTAAAELKVGETDLAREVAVFAERCDIAEEVSRLSAHLVQFRSVMESEEQPGKKLDFIAQEMLREANTIAAKANDIQIARCVVEIKTAIDRIKEQVQNVE